MKLLKIATLVALAIGAASCAELTGGPNYGGLISTDDYLAVAAPGMSADRRISEQDCSKPFPIDGGNIRCR